MARAGAFACFALSWLCGCDGTVVNLGNTAPLVAGGDSGSAGASAAGSSQGGGSPEWVVTEEPLLAQEGYSLANATFSPELVVFSRQAFASDESFVWQAPLAGNTLLLPNFAENEGLVAGADFRYGASNPAVSVSGNELWFSSFVEDTLSDIFVMARQGDTWTAAQPVAELNTAAVDAPRPPGLHGTVMPLSSTRLDGRFHQIYFATRAAIGAPWGEPNQQYLERINVAGTSSVDGFLTDDGLTLYFAAARADPANADLYRATRSTILDSFAEPERLDDVSTAADERDPWLSPDGTWLYYSQKTSRGLYAIYRARHSTP